jgi:hypothetical protein
VGEFLVSQANQTYRRTPLLELHARCRRLFGFWIKELKKMAEEISHSFSAPKFTALAAKNTLPRNG